MLITRTFSRVFESSKIKNQVANDLLDKSWFRGYPTQCSLCDYAPF